MSKDEAIFDPDRHDLKPDDTKQQSHQKQLKCDKWSKKDKILCWKKKKHPVGVGTKRLTIILPLLPCGNMFLKE